jgi:tetratricopeptide (TPR) repeat protein
MRQKRSAWVLALLLLFCYAPSAFADNEEDAKQAMAKGSTLLGKKQYQEALDAYLEALKLVPDRSGPYREIAKCYQLLDKPEEAIHYFTEYLRRKPDAPEKAEYSQTIIQLQSKLPTSNTTPLSITSEPNGAAVYIITSLGEARGIGFTPLEKVAVPSDVSSVRLILATYPTIDQTIDLKGKSPVSLNVPLKATETVKITPPNPNTDLGLEDPQPTTTPVEILTNKEGKKKGLLFASLSTGGISIAAGAVFLFERNEFLQIPADEIDLLNKKRAQLFVEAGVADAMGATSIVLGALWLLRKNKKETTVFITPQGVQFVGSF